MNDRKKKNSTPNVIIYAPNGDIHPPAMTKSKSKLASLASIVMRLVS